MDVVALITTGLQKMSNLDFWGNISSIFGLIITIFVLRTVSNIKSYYRLRTRVPELKATLEDCASKIINFNKDYQNNSREIECELARAEVVLKSLNRKLGKNKSSAKQTLTSISDLQKKLSQNRVAEENPSSVATVYSKIQKVIMEVTEIEKDIKWEH